MTTQDDRMALIGELAAGLAHEIKNPLAGIKGAVDILLEHQVASELDREALEGIQREVSRIDATVCALLALSMPKQMEREIAPLSPSVARATRMAAMTLVDNPGPMLSEVSIQLEPPDGAIDLSMDAAQVERALAELIVNALEALDGNGRVTVRLSRAVEDGQQVARVDILDTGRGIPREDRSRVFNPLFSTRKGAAGLGLAAARRVARSHGGRVEIANADSGGTTVSFVLPIGPAGVTPPTCGKGTSSATMARNGKRAKKATPDDTGARTIHRAR